MTPPSSFVSHSLCFFYVAVRCASDLVFFLSFLFEVEGRNPISTQVRVLAGLSVVSDVMFKVVDGDARNILCEAVKKHHASMLLVGSHGYGAIKRQGKSKGAGKAL